MSLVAVVGDRTSTTAIGLVGAWPRAHERVLVELDPSGGCAAAWLGTPRQPGLSDVVASGDPGRLDAIDQHIQRTPSGLAVLVAPVRPAECGAVVAAATPMLPVMSAHEWVFVADVGRVGGALPPAVAQAGVVVVSHVQHAGSPAAAALGMERLADRCALLTMRSLPTIVALHGTVPYGIDEVRTFLGVSTVVAIADDPWAAAVIAGRPGSPRRLRRSAWWASVERLSDAVAAEVGDALHGHPLLGWQRHG